MKVQAMSLTTRCCFCITGTGVLPQIQTSGALTVIRRAPGRARYGSSSFRASLSEPIPQATTAYPHLVFGDTTWTGVLTNARPEIAGTLLWLAALYLGLGGPRWGAVFRSALQRVLPEPVADFLHSAPFLAAAMAADASLKVAAEGNAGSAIAAGLSVALWAAFCELGRINDKRRALADAEEERAFEAFVAFADRSLKRRGMCHLMDVRSALKSEPGLGHLARGNSDSVLKKFIRKYAKNSRISPNGYYRGLSVRADVKERREIWRR